MIDENKLDDFFDSLSQSRDPKLVKLLQVVASHHAEATQAVLEIVSDQYPTEVEEILEDYLEEEDGYEGSMRGGFGGDYDDEDDMMFGDYDLEEENEERLDQANLLLDNPEALHALLLLIAQHPDLDSSLLELLEDPELDLDLDLEPALVSDKK